MSEEMLREEAQAQAAQAVDETAEEVNPVEEFRQKMSSCLWTPCRNWPKISDTASI